MLEGLEISIIKKGEAFAEFFNGRLDPEFFQKHYAKTYKTILSKPYEFLGDVCFVTDGDHGNATTTETGYSKYYGARNVLSGILSDNSVEYITESYDKKLRKSALRPRDILISCVGANIGFAAIVPDDIGIANIVRNVALIRSKSDWFINEYLLAYLCSGYGKDLYIRMNTGNAQPLVSLDYIQTVPIFKPSIDFQRKIQNLTNDSLEALSQSKQIYANAESLLFDTLGMSVFSSDPKTINIKSFKDSFVSTGRLDAEYYKPKYKNIQSCIINYYGGWDLLENICNLKDINYLPKAVNEYSYIELADIDKSGGVTGYTKAVGSELPSRARRKVRAGDVLISSIEGSLTSCAIVPKTLDGALCSTGFYVLDSHIINSETLLCLFKSELMQNLLKQGCSGTILTAISKTEFSSLPLPNIDRKAQQKIADFVQQSFKLKAQSDRLLEAAKRAVEIAIEQDEAAGKAYLEHEGVLS